MILLWDVQNADRAIVNGGLCSAVIAAAAPLLTALQIPRISRCLIVSGKRGKFLDEREGAISSERDTHTLSRSNAS